MSNQTLSGTTTSHWDSNNIDAVDRLIELLNSLPLDTERWQEIVDEPYG